VSITTDVIAGFPGESPEEFQETYDLCKLIQFSDMHVFPYSKRPGTSAAYLVNQVDDSYKARRVEMLIELMKELASLSRENHLNQTRQVLWESVRTLGGRRQWSGLTDTYQRVYADDNRNLINTITDTIILLHSNGYLWGQAH
jgi:threonylcarbamoyladenosine tRNA methylthiotransferase MtaB